MFKGIDVSSVQGSNIDWHKVAASGVQFVIIKCGNGNSGIDPDFSRNVAAAKAAGLYVACYHFVYPLPPKAGDPSRSPQAQAQAHFNAAQGVLAACDLEWPEQKDWTKWGCTAAQINQWGLDYLAAYSQLSGQQMLIYTYPNFAQTVKLSAEYAQYPLWIASYEPTPAIPAPWTTWSIWQTTGGGGHLPSGAPVDTDVVQDFSLWGTGTPVVNTPNTPNDPNPPVANDPNPPVSNDPNPPTTVAPPVDTTPTAVFVNANAFTAIWNFILKLFGK